MGLTLLRRTHRLDQPGCLPLSLRRRMLCPTRLLSGLRMYGLESLPVAHASHRWPGHRAVQRTPTSPLTDAISLAESYPTPSLHTVTTFLQSAGVFTGSPWMIARSATLPAVTVRSESDSPSTLAPLALRICTA